MTIQYDPNQQWDNLMKRAQAVARKQESTVFIQLLLVVDRDGKLWFWTAPKVIPLEPRLGITAREILEELEPKQMETLLKEIVQLT